MSRPNVDTEDFSPIVDSSIQIAENSYKMKAGEIMKCGVVTIDKRASVYDAIGKMAQKHISGLPVVDDNGLVGIITEKDVLELLYDSEFLPGKVEDYMTHNVVTFDVEDNVKEICDCLINNSYRRVIILHEGRLAGILSRSDLIKVNMPRFKPQDTDDSTVQCNNGPFAHEIMKAGLLTVTADMPIYKAMEILATKDITGLPVVDEYMNLVGILSEKDILNLLYDPNAKPGYVKDWMSTDIVSFNYDSSIFDICECLITNKFRRVPILDNGKLVGIISRTDIIVYIMKNRSAISKCRLNKLN